MTNVLISLESLMLYWVVSREDECNENNVDYYWDANYANDNIKRFPIQCNW